MRNTALALGLALVVSGWLSACNGKVTTSGGGGASGCADGAQNGTETGIDCGGSCPIACADGEGCAGPSDCMSGDCSAEGVCESVVCGHGTRSGDELCDGEDTGGRTCADEGFAEGALGCSLTCDAFDWDSCFGGCGNEIVEAGEACDDGNRVTEEECVYGTLTCSLCDAGCVAVPALSGRFCGDGTVDFADGEVCDDGNNASGDGCSADCLSIEICGNGRPLPGRGRALRRRRHGHRERVRVRRGTVQALRRYLRR